jgi:Na+/H+-dicarboxylate symporter
MVKKPGARRRIGRNHYLYAAVIVAVIAGAIVGVAAPHFAATLQPVGTAFVALIKMMIAPVIFCTIVIGVGSIAKAATVGKIGGLALGYFLVMSTFALGIGLVVGNLLHPGAGLNIAGATFKLPARRSRAPTSSSGSSRRPCSRPSRPAASCRCCSLRSSSGSRCRGSASAARRWSAR